MHTSTVARFPSQTVPLHSIKVGTGVLENFFFVIEEEGSYTKKRMKDEEIEEEGRRSG